MTLPHGQPSYVLWFRPEIIHTVKWAGDPAKAVENRGGTPSLHPRNSFETWTEVVRGSSRPWRPAEIEAAEDLRRRAIEADLTHQIARAEQAIGFRDEIVAVVSHDLKNPLQVIEMAVKVLRPHSLENPRAMTTIGRVLRAVGTMNALIHDLLDVAKIESGRFDVTPLPCSISRLVEDGSAMLAPIAEAKGVRLRPRAHLPGPLEPGRQRHQVHTGRGRRQYRNPTPRRRRAIRRARYGTWDPGHRADTHLRSLLAGATRTERGLRARSLHREGHRRSARPAHLGREHLWRRSCVLLHVGRACSRRIGHREVTITENDPRMVRPLRLLLRKF
jgi:hypothetical protein